MLEHVSIEVPNCETSGWLTLIFSTNFILAAEHEPITIEKTLKYPMAKRLVQYTKVTTARLRSLFHAQRCEYQLVLAPFGHKKSQPEQLMPNMEAFNLALLLADLHFSKHIKLEKYSAIEAGFCFVKGLIALPPTNVAPSNIQGEDNGLTRSSLVHRLDNTSQISHYQAIFSDQVLKQVSAFIPYEKYESCVYFPLIDNESNEASQLSFIKVLYIPSKESQLSIFGITPKFPNVIRQLIHESADLRLMLTGQVFIECSERPAEDQKSWELALVTALQMALGLLPRVDNPVICTGQVSSSNATDNTEIELLESLELVRKAKPVDDTDKKYNLIKELNENSESRTKLKSSANRTVESENLPWLFYLPEANYVLDKQLYITKTIIVRPVEYWHYEELLTVS